MEGSNTSEVGSCLLDHKVFKIECFLGSVSGKCIFLYLVNKFSMFLLFIGRKFTFILSFGGSLKFCSNIGVCFNVSSGLGGYITLILVGVSFSFWLVH